MSDPLEILVVRRFYEELWNAWRLELAEEILATEDRAATRMTWQGTHRGRLCDIEPIGAHIEYCGAAFFRLPGGLIEEYLSREIPHASQGSTTASLRSASPSKSQKDRGRFSYERFRCEIGRVQDDPTDRLAQLSEQMSWLRDAGFDEVDCHFKWLELALMVAVKSG